MKPVGDRHRPSGRRICPEFVGKGQVLRDSLLPESPAASVCIGSLSQRCLLNGNQHEPCRTVNRLRMTALEAPKVAGFGSRQLDHTTQKGDGIDRLRGLTTVTGLASFQPIGGQLASRSCRLSSD